MQDNAKEMRIMKRRGRPRKSKTDNSHIRKPKALRLSDEEEKYIANNARKCRMNFSEYCRKVLMNYKPSVPDTKFSERALYQAEHLGLDMENMQGYNAKMPKSRRAFLTTIREYFARVKMFIDLCMTDMESITNLSGGIKQIEDPITTDSFTIVYRQPVNGYKVTAVAKLAESDVDIISADLTFTKGGKPFTLHTQCFGDTLFCKGRLDFQSENPELFRKYRGKTVEVDYHMSKIEGQLMPIYTPFFFMDLDFDGIEELVIVHKSMAVRHHDGYDVYRIVEGQPVLINYPPYNDNIKDWGFGMTDYPEFDYKKKMISCPYPEGEMKYAGRIIYGVSKKEKDTVIVNGKKDLFNHMEVIKDVKYTEYE